MSFPRILSLAALLLACNAMAGFYASAALAALLESLPASESYSDDREPAPAPAKTRTEYPYPPEARP